MMVTVLKGTGERVTAEVLAEWGEWLWLLDPLSCPFTIRKEYVIDMDTPSYPAT